MARLWFWVGVGFFFPSLVQASPLSDPALRRRLALVYAPEIRQDRKELYGITSIPYFLLKSDLMGMLRGCSRAKRSRISGYLKRKIWLKTPRIRLGEGTWLAIRDHFRWYTDATCDVTYAPFSATAEKRKSKKLLGAPNNLFLRLRRLDDATLLRGDYRFAVVPEISFHAYERQVQRCKKRNFFRLCIEEEIHRYYIIQYFVPLMFNDACNVHEGEHEGMAVLVDARKFNAASTSQEQRDAILKVAYYGHYKTKVVDPKKVTFVEGTHPVAFMGSLGHALYPTSGKTNMSKNFPFEVRTWVTRICRKRKRLAYLTEWHRGDGPVYRLWLAKGHPRAIEKHGVAVPKKGWLDWRGVRALGVPPTQHHAKKTVVRAPLRLKKQLLSTSRPHSVKRIRLPLRSKEPVCCKGMEPGMRLVGTTRPVVKSTIPRKRKYLFRRIRRRIRADEVGLQLLTPKERGRLAAIPAFSEYCLSPTKHPNVRVCDVQGGASNPPCCLKGRWKDYVRWVSFAGRWGKQETFASGLTGAAAANLGRVMKRWPLARSLGNSGPFGPRWIHQTTWNWVDPSKAPAPTPSVWR